MPKIYVPDNSTLDTTVAQKLEVKPNSLGVGQLTPTAQTLLVPTGVIFPYGGVSAPTGWVACDGMVYNASVNPQYAPLYTVIGNAFGGTNNTNFQVPDLRGRFIRGTDDMNTSQGAAGRDTGRVRGTAQAGSTARSSITPMALALGQGSHGHTVSPAQHTHQIITGGKGHDNNTGVPAYSSASWAQDNSSNGWGWYTTDTKYDTWTHSGTGNPANPGGVTITVGPDALPSMTVNSGGDPETRPINVAVHHIIKL